MGRIDSDGAGVLLSVGSKVERSRTSIRAGKDAVYEKRISWFIDDPSRPEEKNRTGSDVTSLGRSMPIRCSACTSRVNVSCQLASRLE